MNKLFKSLMLMMLTLLLVACSGNRQLETFDLDKTNAFYQNGYNVKGADPFVLVDVDESGKDCFYMFLTSGDLNAKGFNVYKSYDLTNWEKDQIAFMAEDNTWCSSKLWAPEVIKDNDTYYMYYSGQWGNMDYGLYISVATSDSPNGVYEEYKSSNKKVSEPLIQFEKHINEIPKELRSTLKGYKNEIGFIKVIDASPFIDPKTNKKYLYFIADIGTDYTENSFVMCMEMEDWVTPIYSTLTRITKYGYVEPDSEELILEGGNTNEGCSVYYHEDSYYLTFSTNTYYTSEYQVRLAVSDNPLGPFRKIQPDMGGIVIYTDGTDVCQSAGHSSFFETNDELFISYHTFYNDKNIDDGRRAMVDRVKFVENNDGDIVMQTYGPTIYPQLSPFGVGKYKNIANLASVTCDNQNENTDIKYLTDEIIPLHQWSLGKEYFINAGSTSIKFEFPDYKNVSGVMIYPSLKDFRRIKKVDSIILECQDNSYEIKDVQINNLLGAQLGKMALDEAFITCFEEKLVKSIEIKLNADDLIGLLEIEILGK